MTVAELIENLLTGTLNNELDRFTNDDFTVTEEKKKIFYLYINEGLTKLYSQFRLKVDELFLASVEGKTDYPITTEHFMSEWLAPTYDKYLWKDPVRPWEDNLIQILDVFDHHGHKMPMNDSNHPFSVYTPESHILMIPMNPVGQYPIHKVYDFKEDKVSYIHPSNPMGYPIETRTLGMVYTVTYQCNHTKITKDDDSIVLPQHLVGVLHSYVAYKIFSNMNTESAVSNANKYLQDYQLSLQDLTAESLVQPEHTLFNNKFRNRGFV